MKKKNKKKFNTNKYIDIFSKFLFGVTSIFLLLFLVIVLISNILPIKYLSVIIIFIVLLELVFGYFLLKKNTIWFKLSISFFAILICFFSMIGTIYLNNTNNFFKNIISGEYESINYNVVVLKDKYNSISDLKDKYLGLLDENNEEVLKSLKNDLFFQYSVFENIGDLKDALFNETLAAIVIDDSLLTIMKEEDETFDSRIKVIYTFQTKTKVSTNEEEKIDVSTTPFALYISGIDQWGNVNTVRGRSDVNIVAIVNPNTHKILLINTPRDYYVMLHGKTGLRDKLTHAGVYGIDMSLNTLEDLYNINIDYYLRVNFDTLIKLVDVIDGIEVYSDTAFNSSHKNGWKVVKGMNSMDGEKALAYSRERYAYLGGDRHRGQNQQDVIAAIIKKTTSSKVILTKYNSILDTLEGSFQTNISTNMITGFIKEQIDKMPKWNIEQVAVSGSDAREYTYSYGTNQKLYVMIPYENDITNVKLKIGEIYGN